VYIRRRIARVVYFIGRRVVAIRTSAIAARELVRRSKVLRAWRVGRAEAYSIAVRLKVRAVDALCNYYAREVEVDGSKMELYKYVCRIAGRHIVLDETYSYAPDGSTVVRAVYGYGTRDAVEPAKAIATKAYIVDGGTARAIRIVAPRLERHIVYITDPPEVIDAEDGSIMGMALTGGLDEGCYWRGLVRPPYVEAPLLLSTLEVEGGQAWRAEEV